MQVGEILTLFVSGVLTLAMLSLIFAPNSRIAETIRALGDSMSQVINSAKSYPT